MAKFLQTDRNTVIPVGANTLTLKRAATGTGFADWFEARAAEGYVELEPMWYECDRTITIPQNVAVVVQGNGAKIKNGEIFREGGAPTGTRLIISDCEFVGGSGQTAIFERTSYSSVIQRCKFTGYDYGVRVAFGLQTLVQQCQFYNCGTSSVSIESGESYGGSRTGTCSNGSVVRDCYAYTDSASAAVYQWLDADNCMLENVVSDGPEVNYHVRQYSPGNTVMKRFMTRNIVCNSPTVGTACFATAQFGQKMDIIGFDVRHAVKLLNMNESSGQVHIRITHGNPKAWATLLTATPLLPTHSSNFHIHIDLGRRAAWDDGWFNSSLYEGGEPSVSQLLEAVTPSDGTMEITKTGITSDPRWS